MGGYETLASTTANVNLEGFQQGQLFQKEVEERRHERYGGFGGQGGF